MALLFIKDYLHDNRNYRGYYKEICIYKKIDCLTTTNLY